MLLQATTAWSQETCSRVATINYQDVLVDVSNKNRGEGLRYYLEKDEVAKQLLDEYQENNRPTWKSAALSTLGTAMLLTSFLRTSDGSQDGIASRNILLFGGATMIAVSYLISKTNQYNNEYLLLKSVEEYNKRNTPKIFFAPTNPQNGFGLGVGVGQEF
ncbi:MAG: hypothetical protein NDI69_05885 [Bacteriovoracaceae bacterium]|nr:hypothetical protein [Bacteriovoracaceae bacterium]